MMKKTISGYKAFQKDMTCQPDKNKPPYQYKEGENYTCEKAIICKEGFHFCLNPLDCLSYYRLCDSVIHHVKAWGNVVGHDENTKKACMKLTVGERLSYDELILKAIEYIKTNADSQLSNSCCGSNLASKEDGSKLVSSDAWAKLISSGDWSNLVSSGNDSNIVSIGNWANLVSCGDRAKLASSGNGSKLEVTGDDGIAAGIGRKNQTKAKKGCWLVLAEWTDGKPKHVKAVKVDGKRIKEDTWYMLENGKFVEAEGKR